MSLLEFLGTMALVAVASLSLIAVLDILVPGLLAASFGRRRSEDSRARMLARTDSRAQRSKSS